MGIYISLLPVKKKDVSFFVKKNSNLIFVFAVGIVLQRFKEKKFMELIFRRKISLPFLILVLLISSAAACNEATESNEEVIVAEAETKEIPITTQSELARDYFLDARDKLISELAWLRAREEFEKAINADSTFALAYLYHAFISDSATRVKNLEQAYKHAQNATEGERELIEAFKSGLHDTVKISQEKLYKLAEKYPEDKYLLWMVGNNYYLKGENDKAIEVLNKTIELDKTFGGGYNLIGYAYLRKKEFDSAKIAFDKYLELYPENANPYDSKADYYRAIKDYENAIAYYQKAVGKDSSFFNYSGRKAHALKDSLKAQP